jgi:predicted nuclease of restriction endonuclease-like (RecB) superfamily
VKDKPTSVSGEKMTPLYERIRQILESARTNVARTVNTTQIVANWLIGREIVEEEQKGKRRANYGEQILEDLSAKLTHDFGAGYSEQNLRFIRQLYLTYPLLLGDPKIRYALRSESVANMEPTRRISNAARAKSEACDSSGAMPRKWAASEAAPVLEICHALRSEFWQPGQLHSNLSWTHYRTLLRVDKAESRAFYEIEAIQNNWSARELERQINSLLYERLALSKDKKGLMRLAKKGQEIQRPVDVFKDPVVMEFLGLPASPKLVESELEQALIDNLQAFLLELGKGFAFVSRQERITLDGDHFYIDLVFYHTVLKCFVLIDLKVGKLTHQDLGQLQLYVNYFDRERRTQGDNPTLGLILCTDKNDAVVRYTLGPDQEKKIFASRYKLYLPTEAELKTELRRGLRELSKAPQGGEKK